MNGVFARARAFAMPNKLFNLYRSLFPRSLFICHVRMRVVTTPGPICTSADLRFFRCQMALVGVYVEWGSSPKLYAATMTLARYLKTKQSATKQDPTTGVRSKALLSLGWVKISDVILYEGKPFSVKHLNMEYGVAYLAPHVEGKTYSGKLIAAAITSLCVSKLRFDAVVQNLPTLPHSNVQLQKAHKIFPSGLCCFV